MTNTYDEANVTRGITLLKERLVAFIKSQQLPSIKVAADRLGLPKSTLSDLLSKTAAGLPKPETLKKLRQVIPLSEEDAKVISVAYRRRRSLSTQRGRAKRRPGRTPEPSKSAVAEPSTLGQSILDRLARLEESVYGGTARLEAVTAPLPSLLTTENFRPVNIRGWEPEKRAAFVRRANELAIELRRSLAALAQLEPDDAREELRKALAENLDELWRHYKIAGALYPLRSVELIRLEGKLSEVLSSRTAHT